MKKRQLFVNKLIYLGISISEMIKIVMREFWYDYVKPKYEKKKKSFVSQIQKAF